jgi:hypothetical protein
MPNCDVLRSHAIRQLVMDEATFRGPSPAANWQQVDARELAALRKLRDLTAEFLRSACDSQPCLPLDLAWSLAEVSDAVSAADEYDNE